MGRTPVCAHVGHDSFVYIFRPLWFWHPKGAKFLVAMVAHVICSCACVICEPKPPKCHVASLPAACLVAINLGPRTATTTLTVTAYVAHLIELAEPHRRAWTSCTIAHDYATSTYVLQSHFRLHGLSRLCHVIVSSTVGNGGAVTIRPSSLRWEGLWMRWRLKWLVKDML